MNIVLFALGFWMETAVFILNNFEILHTATDLECKKTAAPFSMTLKPYMNDGSGNFTDSGQTLSSYDTASVALGDLDGDGDLDVFLANGGSTNEPNEVWFNDGSGNFTDSGQAMGLVQSYVVQLGDLDGDGDLDAFVGNRVAGDEVWFNDGSGNFTNSGQSMSNPETWAAELGDLDGDGDLDVYVAGEGADKVWFNNGSGTFTDSGQSLGTGLARNVSLGDVDQDGDLDAYTVNVYADRLWLNNGSGTFTDSGQNLGSDFTWAIALVDLDGDTDLDAFVGVATAGNKVWLNQGGAQGGTVGTFVDTGQSLLNYLTVGVGIGDFDTDGDPDAFVINSNGGQPNTVWFNQSAGITTQTTVIAYDYDDLYRLISADYTGAITGTFAYGHDAVGNMTAFAETIDGETEIVTRTFNDANQLTPNNDNPLDIVNYFYDGNGNLRYISHELREYYDGDPWTVSETFVYNQRNLMVSSSRFDMVNGNQPVASFVYDGANNRISSTAFSSQDPVTTTYTNDIVGLAQVLVATDGNTTTANLFGLDLIFADDGTTPRVMLADGLGSARVEMVGEDVETVTTYEPYGKVLAQTGTSGTTYGYTGEAHDTSTGLVYLRARYFNPELKVFMSRDPFPGYLTMPASQHGYSYGYNNPVKYIDPSGHIACDSSNLPGMDQGACTHDTQQVIDNNDSYYPQSSRVANAIIGAGMGDALPTEYAHYDNSTTWNSYFRNAAGLISEPLDWFLTGKEILFGDVSLTEGAGMVLLAALPVAQGGWGDDVVRLVPSEIKFSQSSVNGASDIIQSMKTNGWQGPPIDVVKMPNGTLITVDNTRLLAAHEAGIEAHVIIHEASSELSVDMVDRFTTRRGGAPSTWGDAVTNRIQNQNSGYRNTYPNGSPLVGWTGN